METGLKNLVTGKKYGETIAKMGILGIRGERLNDWAEIIGTEDYKHEYDSKTSHFRVGIKSEHQSMEINIPDKCTIIKNIGVLTYHAKYLIISLKDQTSLLVTHKGKVIELGKNIYSSRAGIEFKLIYNPSHNETTSEFMILDIDGEEAIAVVNENGEVLKICTGLTQPYISILEKEAERNQIKPIDGKADYIIYVTDIYKNIIGKGVMERQLYITKELEVVGEIHRGTGERLTWVNL